MVIADATRRLLGAGFELADLGEHELKGIAGMFSSAAHSRAGSCYSRLADLPALFRAPDP